MDKQQITEALAQKYRTEYARYFVMERLAQEALDEGDEDAHKAISRRAWNKSQFLSGLKAAALSLGINEEDFMVTVKAGHGEVVA